MRNISYKDIKEIERQATLELFEDDIAALARKKRDLTFDLGDEIVEMAPDTSGENIDYLTQLIQEDAAKKYHNRRAYLDRLAQSRKIIDEDKSLDMRRHIKRLNNTPESEEAIRAKNLELYKRKQEVWDSDERRNNVKRYQMMGRIGKSR